MEVGTRVKILKDDTLSSWLHNLEGTIIEIQKKSKLHNNQDVYKIEFDEPQKSFEYCSGIKTIGLYLNHFKAIEIE